MTKKETWSRLCPFCEGWIDAFTDECPYCGSMLEVHTDAPQTRSFAPLYQPKKVVTAPFVYEVPLPEKGIWAIFLGGGIAPLSFFLWLLGDRGEVSFTVETTWFPLVTLLAIAALTYGLNLRRNRL